MKSLVPTKKYRYAVNYRSGSSSIDSIGGSLNPVGINALMKIEIA